MAMTDQDARQQESLRYAFLLEWGTRIGLIALLISFTGYLTGFVPAHVPLDQLPQVWNLSLNDYLQKTGTPTGWGWVAFAGTGDLSNLIGIAILASCSLPSLLGVMLMYIRSRDFIYVGICAAVAAVLALAASGILTQGH
jgi:hypothetical protein